MRIIITGGTGLIGSAFARDAASKEDEVFVLSRNPDRARGFPSTVRVVAWDGRTSRGWGELVEGADAVVNLAGASIAGEGLLPKRWTPARKRILAESRVNAGRAVVEAIERAAHKPRCLIQASGIGYYGFTGDREVTEVSPAGDDWLAQLAVQWEAVTAPVENLGVRRVIIRTAGVLSKTGGLLPYMALPIRFFLGGPLGSGQQWFPWISLRDEVAAIRFLIEHPEATGPFNLIAPQPIRSREAGQILAKVLHRPFWLPVPAVMLRLVLGEQASLILEGQRAMPKRLLELGYRFHHAELESALREIFR